MTQLAASDITVGTVLRDTYEITSLLGKGGMGAVFLARHRRLPGKQVAVKVLLHGAGLNQDLYARFRREAEVTSQLGHPHIVEVSDFDTLQDGTPFLVMEYLRGESLEQRLSRGRLPLSEVLTLVRQIGSALQAAHRAGVVHRDLKPANVFLVPTDVEGVMGDRVKLLDFGISKMLDSSTVQTQEAVLIGTPQYMAPEQALGKNSEVGPATDLFALGCIVYEMLSGRAPFAGEGSSLVQVVFRIVHAQPEPLAQLCPDVPSHILAAVERALSKTPQDRHPDVSAFVTELTGNPLQAPTGAAPILSKSRAALPVNTGRFVALTGAGADDGLGATHLPSSTAQFGAPAALAADDGLGATHLPSSTARFGAPLVEAADDGLGATHLPASPSPSVSSSPSRFPNPAAMVEPEGLGASPVLESPLSPPAALAPTAPAPTVSPAPPVTVLPPAPAARTSGHRGLLGALAVLVVLVAAAGVWRASQPRPGSTPVPIPVTTPPPVVVAPPVQKAPVQDAPPPETAPTAPPVAGVTPPVAPTAPVKQSRPATPEAASLPEEAQKLLAEAERALAVSELDQAIELARRSQKVRISGASFSVMTRAYCHQRDLSRANAKWREGQKYMSSRDLAAVRKYCKPYDIEF